MPEPSPARELATGAATTEPAVADPQAAPPARPHPPGDASELDPRRFIALGIVLTAAFMVLLDISIVNVAIPSIQNNLGASFAQVQLVIAGYALAYAVVLITGGRLGDIHGRKRLFMLGMAGFTMASALCGLAPSPEVLVGARILQGLAAALMYPQVLSVIQVSFPPAERAKAFGLFGAIIGVATIAGPLAGGLIIRDDVTGSAWRWVFLVNLPVGIVSLIAASRLLRESRAPHAPKLDLAGTVVVTIGLLLLVWPLVEGREAGWPAWAFISLSASPFVLGAFVLLEHRLTRREASPLIRLGLFRNRSFSVGLVTSLVFIAGVPSFFFTFSLMLQIGLHFSALRAGLTGIPFSIASAFASVMSVRLAPRLGKVILVVGALLIAVGMAAIALTIHLRGVDLNGWDLTPALLLSGLGIGCVIAPLVTVVLSGIPGRDAGAASGVLTTAQQIGGAIGVAVIGVIFFGLLGNRADGVARNVADTQLRTQLTTTHALPTPAIDDAIATFVSCFDRRANANDPSVTPSGCPDPSKLSSSPATPSFVAAGNRALGDNFTSSEVITLGFNVAVFLFAGLVMTLLPRSQRRGGPGPEGPPPH